MSVKFLDLVVILFIFILMEIILGFMLGVVEFTRYLIE